MKDQSRKRKTFSRRFKELSALCRCAAAALGVTEGEFWVWYGSPFILQLSSRK